MWSIDPILTVIAGLITGLVFGFLLQRAHVTRYSVILGQFLFRDFTVLKVMLTAIVVGGLGIWTMVSVGMLEPGQMHIKSAYVAPVILGGLIFGVGMAVLGYCPGTGVAALGDGSRHVIPGILGMIVGAAAFAELTPAMDSLLKAGELTVHGSNKITIADAAGVSPWWIMAAVTAVAAIVFYVIERWERRDDKSPPKHTDAGDRPTSTDADSAAAHGS